MAGQEQYTAKSSSKEKIIRELKDGCCKNCNHSLSSGLDFLCTYKKASIKISGIPAAEIGIEWMTEVSENFSCKYWKIK